MRYYETAEITNLKLRSFCWDDKRHNMLGYAQKYKNHALLQNLNKFRFLDFANSHILPKTSRALSWDQALLSFSWVNKYQAGKQTTHYPRQID